MKRIALSFILMVLTFSMSAQTKLNERGEYEVKQVEEYKGLKADLLFDRTLIVLSDLKGANEHSKFNFDVKEKEGGIIVYKGLLFIGYRKANISGGYNYFADCTLKVRLKDEKVQYTITVPSMTATWPGAPKYTDQIPLAELLPEYNYKGKLPYVKKGLSENAPKIAVTVNDFLSTLIAHTKSLADEEDF